MNRISKLKLINYRRFKKFEFEPNERMNILIGDNEAGKSTILEAIELVSSGNARRVEALGIDRLLNVDAVAEFLVSSSEKTFDKLPSVMVELYLDGEFDFSVNGKNNSERRTCDGIKMVIQPNEDYLAEINDALKSDPDHFPFDYYHVKFRTFADEAFTGYRKKFRIASINGSNMNSEYATAAFVHNMYDRYTETQISERVNHVSTYRKLKGWYVKNVLSDLNIKIPQDKNYTFGLKGTSFDDFMDDLMIFENNVRIDNKGTGKQVLIKTDFALEKAGKNIDAILMEEPENHLSHVNLRKLIQKIASSSQSQIFITTHNSLISARLELRNVFLLGDATSQQVVSLQKLSNQTTDYFLKCPPAGVVEFSLAKKVILLEGPAEYILFEKFYNEINGCKPEDDGVQIMTVRGLSFKRYLEIARITGARVAVVTDNDRDPKKHCVDKYKDFVSSQNIKIFYETDPSLNTFEIVLCRDNSQLCTQLFGSDAEEHMLKNKTDSALELLESLQTINVPKYIKEAVEWIRK